MPPLVLALFTTLAKAGLFGSILGFTQALAIESSKPRIPRDHPWLVLTRTPTPTPI